MTYYMRILLKYVPLFLFSSVLYPLFRIGIPLVWYCFLPSISKIQGIKFLTRPYPTKYPYRRVIGCVPQRKKKTTAGSVFPLRFLPRFGINPKKQTAAVPKFSSESDSGIENLFIGSLKLQIMIGFLFQIEENTG